MKFSKLLTFEKAMLIFILVYSSTALHFSYPEAHLRFIFAFYVILIFYFSTRGLLISCSIDEVEKMISKSGLIVSILSLTYYFMGVYKAGMNFHGNNISYYGLIIDRSIPRLTGIVSDDPNISAFFITLYFFYFLNNLDSNRNRICFIITLICIILTFSRGAYISILIALVISFMIEKDRKWKCRSILLAIIVLFVLVNVLEVLGIGYVDLFKRRFLGMLSSGGSGRSIIWKNAFETFIKNPIFGIGINAFLNYSTSNYGIHNYIHNTFLEVLVESGVVGFFIYGLFLILVFFSCIKLFKKNKETKFLLVTFIGMMFQMFFLSILLSEVFYFIILLIYRYSKEYLSVDTVD
ncbi:O-antigen ligase family protein [Tissierella sp. MSJ-40]|uniref:O-antigen ligase family protein n=1 Tax=Tissierella simiarum TaxID=2841534 RepID=A0ABS6E1N5_9FIRM|nr:O-antigen ligase family protein [Tissierella simiarum]MBU5436818.1 O-antigen ligase family protein [Tissierella simiarum]